MPMVPGADPLREQRAGRTSAPLTSASRALLQRRGRVLRWSGGEGWACSPRQTEGSALVARAWFML